MITHRHHIVPRHMGGTDEEDNLVSLSVEAHAEAHRVLYEQHGHEEDRVAWLALSGQMSMTDAKLAMVKEGQSRGGRISGPRNKGRHRTAEQRKKMSENHNSPGFTGRKHTAEWKAKRSAACMGRPVSLEARMKMSQVRKRKGVINES